MAGSIVKAPEEQFIAFSNQPHMCDICTYPQWEYYTIIITVIRPCEEAESALTCVKAEEHFSHIAVGQQGSGADVGGSAVLAGSILWRSLWPEQWRTDELPEKQSVEFESRDSRGSAGERGGGGGALSQD